MVNAVVVPEIGSAPEVLELELPPVSDLEVRVKIVAAGVCHSDLSMTNGTITPQFPVVLGHEAAGIVTEVGAGVDTVEIGAHVVLNWAAACRECWFCQTDQPWLCTAVEGVTSVPRGILADGTAAHACMGVGAFADEVVLPARSVVPIHDEIPFDIAALMGCAVLTGLGAVRNTASVGKGESVLVVGLGGIGLSAVIGAKAAGADPIIAVDVSPEKEALAREVGATHFLLSEPKLAKQVRALTDGRGADHAFDCVGAPQTIRGAWGAVRRGGRCTIVGVGRRDQEVAFNPLELFHFSRTLTSSIYGESDPDRDMPAIADEVRTGALDFTKLITDRIGLDGVAEAFTRMEAGHGGRSVIWLGED
ncbi:Zn-dependent alcohol dehydrogenase [Gordonia rubripertincta]|uniref:Zn-dependent alcohol dehydrogenase n=2 Tax=Gordonia rubripertincta TaxID=36822 RepID=A0AAW4G4L0_GORRU|nr:Zn-dependent alcohol dehydrogenase [Gordonia rubripertincta]MBM7278010.1 Zn-dependent alcohol dehydrogenase [Gordonia rubripertincta]QMU23237.1 Zn-dependent alcohol dehydrogenase [Gordonia rubripertincta]